MGNTVGSWGHCVSLGDLCGVRGRSMGLGGIPVAFGDGPGDPVTSGYSPWGPPSGSWGHSLGSWGPLWHLGTIFGDPCGIWGHSMGLWGGWRHSLGTPVTFGDTPCWERERRPRCPFGEDLPVPTCHRCPLADPQWYPARQSLRLDPSECPTSPPCHHCHCVPSLSLLPLHPHGVTAAPLPHPYGVTAAPHPHVPMVSLLPPCPVPMSPRCPRRPPIPAVPTEGRSLKDEDVLQSLPVGTTATFYFRDLGAQISWVTVSGCLSPSVPLSFRLCPSRVLAPLCPSRVPRPSHALLSLSVDFCLSVRPMSCPSFCPSAWPSVPLSIPSSIRLSMCPSVRPMSLPSVHPMFPCPFVCPFVHLCIHLMSPHHPTFFWPSLWSSVPLSIPLSILLSVPRPSVFLSIDVISCLCPFLRPPHVSLSLCPSHVLLSVSLSFHPLLSPSHVLQSLSVPLSIPRPSVRPSLHLPLSVPNSLCPPSLCPSLHPSPCPLPPPIPPLSVCPSSGVPDGVRRPSAHLPALLLPCPLPLRPPL